MYAPLSHQFGFACNKQESSLFFTKLSSRKSDRRSTNLPWSFHAFPFNCLFSERAAATNPIQPLKMPRLQSFTPVDKHTSVHTIPRSPSICTCYHTENLQWTVSGITDIAEIYCLWRWQLSLLNNIFSHVSDIGHPYLLRIYISPQEMPLAYFLPILRIWFSKLATVYLVFWPAYQGCSFDPEESFIHIIKQLSKVLHRLAALKEVIIELKHGGFLVLASPIYTGHALAKDKVTALVKMGRTQALPVTFSITDQGLLHVIAAPPEWSRRTDA